MASRRPSTRANPKGPPATPISDPEEILRKARALLRQTSSAAQKATSGISRNHSAIISVSTKFIFVRIGHISFKIYSGSKTGVVGGPLGFSPVLGLLEATLYQWSCQIDDYNHNSLQALSIIKAWIYVVSQGS